MRFYTALLAGREEVLAAFQEGGRAYSLRRLAALAAPLAVADMQDLIKRWPQLQGLLASLGRSEDVLAPAAVDLAAVQLLAPLPRPRQDVICLGINYAEHGEEAGSFSKADFGGQRPATIYFSKRVNQATAPNAPIPSHAPLVDSLDYECELAVILGRDCYAVPQEEALDYVFGYTILNDVSARNLQTRHRQWYLGKSLDGFTPMGPCIVTAQELGEPQNLAISCHVNGQLRQSSNTSLMLQTVAGAIAELSAGLTLQAGTIIATGTPAGVGMGFKPPRFLQPGDVVDCYIEKIGHLINQVC